MACLQALALMHKLGLQPRRTIRVAFWVNERERRPRRRGVPGICGRPDREPRGRHRDGRRRRGAARVRRRRRSEFARNAQTDRTLLARVGAAEISGGGGGADIAPLTLDGVPGLSERTAGTHYFDWHHSEADTLDKVNPEDFRKNVAALAVMGYVLADMPGRLAAGGGGRRGQ